MQENNLNIIQKLRVGSSLNATVLGACQMLKHYRALTGDSYDIRFTAKSSNEFSAYDIQSITFSSDKCVINTNVRALHGTLGALPRMLSLPLFNEHTSGMSAGYEFIQFFEERYCMLLVRADLKYNICRQKEEESFTHNHTTYRISDLLGSLLGIIPQCRFKYLDKSTLVKYIPILGDCNKNPSSLIKVLKDYFKLKFTVEYAPLQMRKLAPDVWLKIGSTEGMNNSLGYDTVLGQRVPIYGQNIKIRIEIESFEQFRYVFEKKNLLEAIKEMCSFYLGDKQVFSLVVVSDAERMPRIPLESSSARRLEVGRTICICSKMLRGKIEIPIK